MKRILLGLMVAVLAIAAGAWLAGRGYSGEPRVTFVSVGQGDCGVIQSGGYTVLVDVGPGGERGDAGQLLVAPALHRLGVGRIDMLLLTHPHDDHYGALGAVLKQFKVGQIVMPACYKNNTEFLTAIRRWGVDAAHIRWLKGGASLELPGLDLELYAPVDSPPSDLNDGSLFVRATAYGRSVMFSGDAYIDVENRVAGSHPQWRAQVVKAGHHGSRTSTGTAWLNLLQPDVLVVSCGRNNRYGHPHPSVLKAAAAHGLQVLRTDLDGDISFVARPSGWVRVP